MLHFNSESITEFKKETNKTSRYYYITHFKSIKIFAAFTIFVQKIPRMRFERMTYRLEVAYGPIFKGFQVLLELVRSYYFYYLRSCFLSQPLPPFARIYQDFCKKVVVLMWCSVVLKVLNSIQILIFCLFLLVIHKIMF